MKINPIMPRKIVNVGASKSPKGMSQSPVKGLSPKSQNTVLGLSIAGLVSGSALIAITNIADKKAEAYLQNTKDRLNQIDAEGYSTWDDLVSMYIHTKLLSGHDEN